MKSLKTLLLVLSITTFASAQNSAQSFRLNSIEFIGLKKTKEVYLHNILALESEDAITVDKIRSSLQILRNLPSIAQAEYQVDTLDNEYHLRYIIEERRTALPIINFGGIRDNIWFSLGVTEHNFRGQGDLLLAYYQNNNGLHSGQVYYRKPRILNSDWGYGFSLNKWSSLEPVFFDSGTVDYYYDNNGVGLSLLRNLGLKNQIEIGGTYFLESYTKADLQSIENPPGPNDFSIKKFLTKFEFKQHYLNYDHFYVYGFETLINYQNVLSIGQNNNFNSVQFQGKLFTRPSTKLNLAFRLKLAISSNEDSPFAPFVADSHVNIRGIGNRIDRGTAQVVFNIEGRYTVLHQNYWSSQIIAFADSGTWRNPGGELKDIFDQNQFRQFVGLGFRLNYQKVFGATLRVDYGIDLYDLNQRGIVIGLGQYY